MSETPGVGTRPGFSFSYVTGLVWRQKLAVSVFCVLTLLLAIIYLNVTKPTYTVTFKITPAISSSSRSAASRLGNLASLAGINIPQDDNSMGFEVYLVELQGRAAAAELVRNQPLMRRLFPKEWDDATGQWRQPPSGILHPLAQGVKFLFGMKQLPWSPPDGARVEKILDDDVHISKTPYTPVVTISMDSKDPETASLLLWSLHQTVDDFIRQRTLKRTERYIAYLTKQLALATVNDYREALITSLVEQQKARMTASSGLPFAAEPVEPPVIASLPSSPNGPVVIFLALMFGLAAGGLVGLLLDRRGLTLRAIHLLLRRRAGRDVNRSLQAARDPAE
jgi:hypothetical protein